jgi:hypothetical protein
MWGQLKRCTECLEVVRRPHPFDQGQRTPAAAVMLWPVQCVASHGGSVSVGSTIRSISAPAATDAGQLLSCRSAGRRHLHI